MVPKHFIHKNNIVIRIKFSLSNLYRGCYSYQPHLLRETFCKTRWFDGSLLQVSLDGNTTISTIQLVPSITQHGKALKCRAENPNLPGSVLENFITLEVSCKYLGLIIASYSIFHYKWSSFALYMVLRSK